jgi:undecaprenyl-diphosphatase
VAELPLRHAIALGLLQGPTELLPVSSSGHTTLIPWLARWPAAELEPELRKAFEVALHAGSAAALGLLLRGEVARTVRGLDRRGASLLALSFALPALVGGTLERPIERRLSGPGTIAIGLALGGLAMVLADTHTPTETQVDTSTDRGTDGEASAQIHTNGNARADRGEQAGDRPLQEAGALDGLLLGFAQSVALLPGVSRNGATITAARARGFGRADAATLSWRVALPVILGATALKGRRLRQRGIPTGMGGALAAGAGGAFLSTLACAPLLRDGRRGRGLAPYALYRGALALAVARRVLRDSRR